jgi:UDP-glucuronate decarboxylase
MKLMFSDEKVTGPINLGNPREFTMLELAEKVISVTNSSSKIEFHELPQDDPKQRKPDISKANSILNWNPTVELEKGLELTVSEFITRV